MLGRLFSRNQPEAPAIDASAAAAALSRHRAAKDRARVHAMTNQMRADMAAKGIAFLPQIDWENQ